MFGGLAAGARDRIPDRGAIRSLQAPRGGRLRAKKRIRAAQLKNRANGNERDRDTA
jgi:hypothetical protein